MYTRLVECESEIIWMCFCTYETSLQQKQNRTFRPRTLHSSSSPFSSRNSILCATRFRTTEESVRLDLYVLVLSLILHMCFDDYISPKTILFTYTLIVLFGSYGLFRGCWIFGIFSWLRNFFIFYKKDCYDRKFFITILSKIFMELLFE